MMYFNHTTDSAIYDKANNETISLEEFAKRVKTAEVDPANYTMEDVSLVYIERDDEIYNESAGDDRLFEIVDEDLADYINSHYTAMDIYWECINKNIGIEPFIERAFDEVYDRLGQAKEFIFFYHIKDLIKFLKENTYKY